MNTVIRVGIAGLGRSGWGIHCRLLEPMGDRYRVVAVADRIKSRQQDAAARFGCRTYDDLPAMLRDGEVDLVVNSLPSYLHPSGSIAALTAGKHVVCEKPMAVRVSDADAMIEAARKAGRVLTAFQSRRYAADLHKIQEVIASGKLGRIVMIRMASHGFGRRWDWQTLQRYDGGSLNNNGVHMLDAALQLFGSGKPEVFCHLERALTCGDADDHVKIILRGPNAPMIDLELTSACAFGQDEWLVMGTRGSLTGSGRELRWKYFVELPPREVDDQPTPDRNYNREEIPWVEEQWQGSDSKGPGLSAFYLDLYETLCHGKPLVITPESVRRNVEIMAECHERHPYP